MAGPIASSTLVLDQIWTAADIFFAYLLFNIHIVNLLETLVERLCVLGLKLVYLEKLAPNFAPDAIFYALVVECAVEDPPGSEIFKDVFLPFYDLQPFFRRQWLWQFSELALGEPVSFKTTKLRMKRIARRSLLRVTKKSGYSGAFDTRAFLTIVWLEILIVFHFEFSLKLGYLLIYDHLLIGRFHQIVWLH